MNFRKSSKGGGSFSIQKFMLQIFAIIDDTSVMNFRKNLQHNFPKMRGGGQRPFGTFPKIHPFLEEVGIPYLQLESNLDRLLFRPS